MARFFIPREEIKDGKAVLPLEEAIHSTRVLRLSQGDTIELFDGQGRIYRGNIIEKDHLKVTVKIHESFEEDNSPAYIILGQSLLKRNKMDLIVQKATELDVAEIYPLTTQHSIPRMDEESMDKKIRRWRRIALEASKQCKRASVPPINPIRDLPSFINDVDGDYLKLILWERGECPSFKEIFRKNRTDRKIILLIGPEGGFSEKEILLATAKDFQPVSLGKRILRSETAALAALTIVQYEISA